jgi:methionyl-tRNA synthetase
MLRKMKKRSFHRFGRSAIFGSFRQRSEKGNPMITIDEFRKLELKIGTVKKAEPHPNADRLMVLQVDLGSEERQIIAGIRGHYTPEELMDKQVVIAANLETARLRGLESQGMVLAASDGDRIVILTPEKRVASGAKVS